MLRNTLHAEPGFYGALARIALPTAGANLLSNAIGLADTFMVGSLGDSALSATTLANKYGFIFWLFLFGVVSGGSVLSSQYFGKRDFVSIEKILCVSLRFTLGIGLLFSLGAAFCPLQIMRLFTNLQEIITLGAGYLRIISPTFLIMSFTVGYYSFLRSVERANLGLAAQGTTFCTNTFFNAVFIYGLLGAPAMGVNGAALGTLLARIVELLIILVYAATARGRLHISPKRILLADGGFTRDFVKYAAIVVMNESLWGIGTSIHSAIYGRMSTAVVAASSLVLSVGAMASVLGFSVANAAGVFIGKTVGRNQFDKTRRDARILLRLSLVIAVLYAAIMGAAGLFLPDLRYFALSEEARSLAKEMFLIRAVTDGVAVVNCVVLVGILRGGGDTKFVAVIDVIFMYGVALPLGALGALVFGWPPAAVMAVLASDEVLKLSLALYRYKTGRWMNNVTRVTDESGALSHDAESCAATAVGKG
ncbi:MAG: MATE family efflux transporter [Oscillospiraceae bacterium]|jgi:putative MATE family efflux protein|nr:MATE family efflux transporter [Oscillospiraceae bacterium]